MQAYRCLGQSLVAAVYAQNETTATLSDDQDEGSCDPRESSSSGFIEGRSSEGCSAALSETSATAGVADIDYVLNWIRETTSGFEWLEESVDR